MPDLDTLTPAEREAVTPARTPADLHLSGEMKEEGVFASLVSSFRDVFFPAKLPPLVLESTPIAVPDPMATKMSPASIGGSIAFYALLLLIIGYFITRKVVTVLAPKTTLTQLVAPPVPPPIAPKPAKMGGGGGAADLTPVSKGRLPKLAQDQIVPPKAPPTIPPKLAVDPSIVVQKDLKLANNNMPNLGMPTATGPGVSLGNGGGGGLGNGHGNGLGVGEGGNTGGGVNHIGGEVKAPVVLVSVDPEFSEEARKAKFSGNVQVYLWVDENGNPSHVRVVRGVGMGLDEKAVEAVRQYKFRPATKNGKPVKVDLYIDVNFQIF